MGRTQNLELRLIGQLAGLMTLAASLVPCEGQVSGLPTMRLINVDSAYQTDRATAAEARSEPPRQPAVAPSRPVRAQPAPVTSVPDASVSTSEVRVSRPRVRRGHWQLKGKVGLNISADFSGLGSFPAQTAPGATTATAGDRFYDDGFNQVDASGLGDGKTWFWGYSDASQVRTVGATTLIDMNSSTVVGDGSVGGAEADPAPGFELNYMYPMRDYGQRSWGFLGGVGYTLVKVKDSQVVAATESRRTDTFDATGAVVPAAPFAGTAAGPHPRIDNAPSASVTALFPGGALIGGSREIDANVFDFRVGPYAQAKLVDRFMLMVSGGFVGAFIASEFSVNESTTVTGMSPTLQPGVSATQTSRSSESDTGFVAGAFVGLDLHYHAWDSATVFLGAQYQYLTEFKQALAGRQATLKLDSAIFVHGGVS